MLPAAIAGASLCAARLSGKLNGLMAATGPIGKRRVMPMRPLRRGHQVERDGLAGHPLRLLGAEAEGEHGAVDLDQRVADGLAGLERDRSGASSSRRSLMPALISRRMRAALVGRQAARLLERRDRGLDGLLVLLGRGVVGGAGGLIGMGRVGDLEHVGRIDPAAGKEDGMGLDAGEGHRRGILGVTVEMAGSKAGGHACQALEQRPN